MFCGTPCSITIKYLYVISPNQSIFLGGDKPNKFIYFEKKSNNAMTHRIQVVRGGGRGKNGDDRGGRGGGIQFQ